MRIRYKWEIIYFYDLLKLNLKRPLFFAQYPTPFILSKYYIRIFFASRDENNYSQIYYVDVTLKKDKILVSKLTGPVLKRGDIGSFDEHGVYPSSIVNYDGKYYLYYIGWLKGDPPPLFYASIGLAISKDGEVFRRVFKSPIFSRNEFDPYFVTGPFVFLENNKWKMFYTSGIKWTKTRSKGLQSYYHIKYTESKDGINWEKYNKIVINFYYKDETNITRATILKNKLMYKYSMWFSYVRKSIGKYRVGFAYSNDGINWIRDDTLSGVESEYASEIAAYPFVFEKDGNIYMLYNKEDRGRTGFGIAKLVIL